MHCDIESNWIKEVDVTYWDFTVCHEDGEVGEVVAGAGGVRLIGVQEFAALGGPVAHHTPLRVIPEGAIGVEVVIHLQITRDMVKCPNNWLPEIEVHVEHRGHLPPTHTKYFSALIWMRIFHFTALMKQFICCISFGTCLPNQPKRGWVYEALITERHNCLTPCLRNCTISLIKNGVTRGLLGTLVTTLKDER